MNANVEVRGDAATLAAPQLGRPHVIVQMRFALQNAMAAAYFSRRVQQIEDTHTGQPFGAFFEEILWNSSACIFSTAASLEAYANEIFSDRQKHFPNHQSELLDAVWLRVEREGPLDKLSFALLLRSAPDFDTGKEPYQSAKALVALRNALVHFKPEWPSTGGEHAKLSSRLASFFTGSSFLPDSEDHFPRRWATHSCTSWAVQTLGDTIGEFERKASLGTNLKLKELKA